MKKIVLMLSFLMAMSLQANVFFSYCANSSSQSTIGFTSCVNNNFNKAASKFEGIVPRFCFLTGSSLFGFESCVNSNFQRISLKAEGSLYLGYCYNVGDSLSLGFESCINRNFGRVATYLNQIDDKEQERLN